MSWISNGIRGSLRYSQSKFSTGLLDHNYNYTTIGDLRVGRNLKFVGTIYNFGLYGVALNEDEVQENWEESRKYVEN